MRWSAEIWIGVKLSASAAETLWQNTGLTTREPAAAMRPQGFWRVRRGVSFVLGPMTLKSQKTLDKASGVFYN